MNQHFLKEKDGQKLQDRFLELRKELSNLEWITHGSVTPNHPGNWRWTTKVKAKTVTLSLSAEQADLFKEAIAANRKVESILNEMRAISQEILLKSAPGTRKNQAAKSSQKGLNLAPFGSGFIFFHFCQKTPPQEMVGTEPRGDVAVQSWVKLEVDPPRVGALPGGL